jgi:hypothetical protein
MDIKHALTENDLPNDQLKALWNVSNGNWERAHEIAQSKEGDRDYDRIHAYLHREEGDRFNAGWWYRQLGMEFPKISLQEEWEELVKKYS